MAEVHGRAVSRARQMVAIFLVSLAGLLLEVGYTRIVSYKLWYYYTYLVIGLALLGIGSGGIFVVLCQAPARDGDRPGHRDLLDLRRDQHRRSATSSSPGSRSTRSSIWDYGTAASFKNLGDHRRDLLRDLRLVHRARDHRRRSILGRAPEGGIGRLYFADLIGAGLGCLAAIPLITRLGPPEVIMLSALIFAVVGCSSCSPRRLGVAHRRRRRRSALVLLLLVTSVVSLPDVRTEDTKAGPENAAVLRLGPGVPGRRAVRRRPTPTDEPRSCSTTARSARAMNQFDGDAEGAHPLRHRPPGAPVRGARRRRRAGS